MTKLYFAYGMNLNHEHMAKACPTAVPIGPRKIQGYRLVFRQYADIVESHPDDYVMGGCWEIDDIAEASLDFIEGYPLLYRKITVDDMLVYQMNDFGYCEEKPAQRYLSMIREGLADFGYDVHSGRMDDGRILP